jgi:hypothetical protein
MPTFEKNIFWEIVEKYPNKILSTEFLMISPNLSNISDALNFDLNKLHKDTNTQETTLRLQSDKESNLTLTKENDFIASIVDYSSEGGGNIKVKVKGLRKTIRTQDSVMETSVNSLNIDLKEPSQLLNFFKGLLK